MKRVLQASALVATVFATTAAQAIVLDFEGFDAGTVLTNQVPGVTITAENNAKSFNLATVFDSNNPTGGDTDLRTGNSKITTNYGNILIINENNNFDNDGRIINPDDERKGGTLRFDFDQTFNQGSIVLIDTEEVGKIDFYDINDANNPTQTINFGTVNDGYSQVLNWSGFDFNSMKVTLNGSGAVGEIEAVPEPATLTLFALGALTALRKRKQKA